MSDLDRIRELNRFPFVEIGFCFRCGQSYRLVQLVLPLGRGESHGLS